MANTNDDGLRAGGAAEADGTGSSESEEPMSASESEQNDEPVTEATLRELIASQAEAYTSALVLGQAIAGTCRALIDRLRSQEPVTTAVLDEIDAELATTEQCLRHGEADNRKLLARCSWFPPTGMTH
jgi:hypothetical protein